MAWQCLNGGRQCTLRPLACGLDVMRLWQFFDFLAVHRVGAKKSLQTFSAQSYTEKRGRPRHKVCFPAAPVTGRNFLNSRYSGVRVWTSAGKYGPKSLSLCLFFFPDFGGAPKGRLSDHSEKRLWKHMHMDNNDSRPIWRLFLTV